MNEIILEGVVGSTAYGLNTPESDIDTLGVYLKPLRDLVSLTPGDDTIVQHDPDATYHEVNKFVSLLVKNNPTVMEFLWLSEYTQQTWEGEILVNNRDLFLSQNVRNTYGGYAMQQKERLLRRGDFGSDLKKRTEKHGRHCFRLLIQGIHILRHGEINVRLSPEEIATCRLAGETAATEPDRFASMFDMLDKEMRNTPSDLPEKVNIGIANDVIWEIRGF